jgi:hypothetical protein
MDTSIKKDKVTDSNFFKVGTRKRLLNALGTNKITPIT